MSKAYEAGEKAGMNNISPAASPSTDGIAALEWMRGWMDGRTKRNLVYAHEAKLYRLDEARMTMLWG